MRVMLVFGTRPEAIKMAPLVLELKKRSGFETVVCVTAQHRQMLDQVLDTFQIKPDLDLDLMGVQQDLFDITSKCLLGLRDAIAECQPDFLLVHGDTTSCMAAALAAYYTKVPVGHVEAGLRTGNIYAPFPEEINRAVVGRMASLHFAPTESARQNLLAENVNDETIVVTGNTVIDALLIARQRAAEKQAEYWASYFSADLLSRIRESAKLILVTGHRRENFGQGFTDLCSAIKTLAEHHSDYQIIYPVHMNPNVREPVDRILSDLANVSLIEPLDYLPFVWLMDQSDVILTDSGGIQEEAPSLGVPVLVMRDVTERPEALASGTVELVGTNQQRIIDAVERVLSQSGPEPDSDALVRNPYGDGKACSRIIKSLQSVKSTAK